MDERKGNDKSDDFESTLADRIRANREKRFRVLYGDKWREKIGEKILRSVLRH